MLPKIDFLQLFLKLIHIGFQLFLKHEGHYVGSQGNECLRVWPCLHVLKAGTATPSSGWPEVLTAPREQVCPPGQGLRDWHSATGMPPDPTPERTSSR